MVFARLSNDSGRCEPIPARCFQRSMMNLLPRHLLTGIAVLLAAIPTVTAQDLLVQYDFFSGDVSYFRFYVDGKTYQTVDNSVGKGSRVVVRVVNLNQNIYSVNALSTGRPISLPSRSTDLIAALSDARKAGAAAVPSPTRDRWDARIDAARAREDANVRAGRAQAGGGGSRGTDVSTVAKGLMSRIQGQENAFHRALAKYYSTIDQTISRAAPLGSLLEATAESRNLSEVAVKRQVIDVLQSILGDAPQGRTAGFSISDIIKYSASGYAVMSAALEDVQKFYIELDASYEQMLALVEKYPSALGIAVSDTSLNGGFLPVERWIQNDHRTETITELIRATSVLDHLRPEWNSYFREIAELYSAIQAMSFSYQFEIPADGDRVEVKIDIHDHGTRAERARGDAVRLVSSRNYEVPVVGGWKINASLGMAGSYFFHHQNGFGIVDGKITSALIDRFTPSAAAYVHIYRRAAAPITFGPTIGAGMSLNRLHAAQFMLGGSLVMGDGEQMVITTGMIGGQVAKLTPGYYIGAPVVGNTVPTEEGFDVGLFIGMSYSLFGR